MYESPSPSNFQSQGAVSDSEVDLNVAVPGDECSVTVKVMSLPDVISAPVVGCTTKSFKTGLGTAASPFDCIPSLPLVAVFDASALKARAGVGSLSRMYTV